MATKVYPDGMTCEYWFGPCIPNLVWPVLVLAMKITPPQNVLMCSAFKQLKVCSGSVSKLYNCFTSKSWKSTWNPTKLNNHPRSLIIESMSEQASNAIFTWGNQVTGQSNMYACLGDEQLKSSDFSVTFLTTRKTSLFWPQRPVETVKSLIPLNLKSKQRLRRIV